MITELRIYWQSNPLFSDQGNNFTVGEIDDTGALAAIANNNPALNIQILEPANGRLVNNNSTIIVTPDITNNITLRLQLTYMGHTQYFSYVLVPPITQMTQEQIFKNYVAMLPKNVYTTTRDAPSTVKQLAITSTIYQLYDNVTIENPNFPALSTVLQNMYPISGEADWEIFLTGRNRLLFQSATQYGALLQLIYQVEINNNTNPYWLAYNISQYIYYWLGFEKYVYVSEGIIPNITDAFILNNNKLSQCIFSGNDQGSRLVVFYVLTDNPGTITEAEQAQIYDFARQVTRAGMRVQVIFTESAADLGLTIDLGNTYWKDPRQGQTYCIQYNPKILDQALGLAGAGSGSISNVIDFTLTLIPGGSTTTLQQGDSYQVVITPVFSVPTVLPNPIIQYTEFFSLDTEILTTSMVAGTEYFNAVGEGAVTVNVYLGIIFKSYTYNVTASGFILDVSLLDSSALLY